MKKILLILFISQPFIGFGQTTYTLKDVKWTNDSLMIVKSNNKLFTGILEEGKHITVFENGIFVAYANSTGHLNNIDFMGESKIIGPDGIDISNAGNGEKLITAEIDMDKINFVRQKLQYLNDSLSLQ